MKIVKKTGEQILPHGLRAELKPVLAFTGAGTALWTGSCELVDRAWKATDDYSTRDRLFALGIAGYLAAYGCWHAPHIARFAVPGAIVIWCVAAWCIAPPTVHEEATEEAVPVVVEAPSAQAPDDVYAATLAWIREQIGDRQGVHLRDLLDHAQQHGMFETLDVTELRTHLERWGIPVRKRVRVRGLGITVGIHGDDLPPLPDPDGQDPPDPQLHAA